MDPVTRIEGHMKVEVTIDTVGGIQEIVDARCTGTLFRGFENILQGRDPLDAPVLTQRICGVCPVSHGLAATLALDAAGKQPPPPNARILRNLTLASNYLQSHILHFYLLAALDYVKGPTGPDGKVSAPWSPSWEVDMREGLTDIGGHIPKAIEARRRSHEMGAIFGGRMPLPHTIVPGGFTAVPTNQRISAFRDQLEWLTDFIENTYIPDVQQLGAIYEDFFSIGTGCGNLLAFGVFDLDERGSRKLLAQGTAIVKNKRRAGRLNPSRIVESVTHSWYDDATDNLKVTSGQTLPVSPKDKTEGYSWLKAPRYARKPYEAGPLARMWISGDYRNGASVMDRHMARAQEALKVARAMADWLDELTPNGPVFTEYTTPQSGTGVGLTEAPRGALGHWVRIADGKIASYQVITPTCWNASPRDNRNIPGPMEQALVGTPIENPAQPVEALRVIHSFDPCLSCAVHVMRPGGPPVVYQAGANP
jgi:hydrogenase large subunit